MTGNSGPIIHVRSAFISDIHLGSRECRADLVLDFLRHVQMDQLFLVGDIVDIWSMRRSFYWPQIHNDVLRTILGKTKHGTRVIYVPGNHDEQLREICGSSFGNLEIHREYVHTTLRGLELLVMHGDEFDGAVKCSRWLAALGSGLYDVTLGRQPRSSMRCGVAWAIPIGRWPAISRAGSAMRSSMCTSSSARPHRRRGAAASTASSAGISIGPRSSSSRACSIATMATGSIAARRSSKTAAANSSYGIGTMWVARCGRW